MNSSKIGHILRIMERAAKKRNAPVFQLEKTKTTPFRILIFTMLSSRTKDTTTIPIAQKLFSCADTPRKMLCVPLKQLEKILYGIGFYKTKAKNIHKICRMLLGKFNGKVPNTLEELIALPGVGRKTANIVLNSAFGKATIAVDTHVHRLSNRLGLVKTKTPEKTELFLHHVVPPRYKGRFNKILVGYGQTVCQPISPWCSICKLCTYCPRIRVQTSR